MGPADLSVVLTTSDIPSQLPLAAPRQKIGPASPDPITRRVRKVGISRLEASGHIAATDEVAAEEPLEIQVEGRSIAVVMRTPGDDHELAAGFLVTEGLIKHPRDIRDLQSARHCAFPLPEAAKLARQSNLSNLVNVLLTDPRSADLEKLTRHVFTSSSCGICSKASIAAVQQQFPPVDDPCHADPQVILALPQSLAHAQQTFQRTGGLHACGLFDLNGNLVVLREDVGRHNALDKIIGWALLDGRLPLREHIVLLSGRTSFEMMQKALAGGVAIIAAVSAPSSLAVEFARDSGQTLIGFLRPGRMNVYAGENRLWRTSR